MIRNIAIIVLLVLIAGAAVYGIVVYKQKQQQEEYANLMHMAEAAIKSENYEQATVHLEPLLEIGDSYEQSVRVLYLMASAQQKIDPKEAFPYWDQLVREYPNHEHYHQARLFQARVLSKTSPDEALKIFQELKTVDDPKISGEALLGIAKTHDQNNESEKAEGMYYRILELNTLPEIIASAKDRLTEINTKKIWSPGLDEFSQLYTVQKGDSPAKIGQLFKTTAWYVQEANNIKRFLRPGQRLKVPAEPYRVVVDKNDCSLNLVTMSGRFVKWYPVGIGEQSYKTPVGTYTIVNKEIDPVWYRPSGGIIQSDDPENALGDRWMGIGNSLGIHGTNEPDTIGFRKSAGCIRMYNHDVEELYKILTYGSYVTIAETPEQMREAMNPIAVEEETKETTEESTSAEETETSS